jgi:hypothetical protein
MRWFLIAFAVLSILALGQGVMARAVFSDGRLPLSPDSSAAPVAETRYPSGAPVDPTSTVRGEGMLDPEDPSLPGLLMLVAGLAGLKLAGDRPWADVTRRRGVRRRTELP